MTVLILASIRADIPGRFVADPRLSDTSALVDRLDAAGAKATFFFTGTLYGEWPQCE